MKLSAHSSINPRDNIRDIAYNCLLSLATEDGINASGKDDVYGCIFGRDSAITILKVLNTISRLDGANPIDTDQLLSVSRRSLLKLTELQGQTVNIESGEEPGKFIHEYRTENYDRLLNLEIPWYVYPDGVLRNYDSIDSTPLALIAIHRYYSLTQDGEFLLKVLPAVEKGLNWIISYGDRDKDYLVEYELLPERRHGGLAVQSWTDSIDSVLQSEGKMPQYPIAPVEVQGYVWLALNLWADYYEGEQNETANTYQFAQRLRSQAQHLKEAFQKAFLFTDSTGLQFAAQILDGDKNQIRTVTGNPLLLLWSTYEKNGSKEGLVSKDILDDIVNRSFMSDMFDDHGGIRTMSTLSPFYNGGQDSYHNGSFWPKINGMAHFGLMKWGYEAEAALLRKASLYALNHFGTPIELYIKTEDGQLIEWVNGQGQRSCREQAWSAAAALELALQ